ncbi:MAG: sugar phosphorylase, partial [Anaerolineae bacterium]
SGVPGIYVHSLFGSRNCQPCVAQTGRARSINREKFQVAELEALLAEPSSHQQHVFQGYSRLLRLRRGQRAFHPGGSQQVLAVHDSVFALLRRAPDTQEPLLCLINLAPTPVDVKVELGTRDLSVARSWHDLVDGATMTPTGGVLEAGLAAYQVRWLV